MTNEETSFQTAAFFIFNEMLQHLEVFQNPQVLGDVQGKGRGDSQQGWACSKLLKQDGGGFPSPVHV